MRIENNLENDEIIFFELQKAEREGMKLKRGGILRQNNFRVIYDGIESHLRMHSYNRNNPIGRLKAYRCQVTMNNPLKIGTLSTETLRASSFELKVVRLVSCVHEDYSNF